MENTANKMDLFCGDCMTYLKNVPNKSMTCTVTDIPYGEVNRKSNGLRNLDKKDADIVTFSLEDFVEEICRVTSGSIYIFCSTEQVSAIRSLLVKAGASTRLCIWEKTNPSPMNGKTIWLSGIECCVYGKFKGATFNEHCKNTVFRFPTVRGKIHPTQKPVALLQYLIETSTRGGDTVFDPCMGSGTTGVAALKSNRNFIGVELNPEYFKEAKKRLEQVG